VKATPLYTADKYTYRVLWSAEDQQHVGRCSEFPALQRLAPTAPEALEGIIAIVACVLEQMRTSKMDPPPPLAIRLLGGQAK
jgi:hypothetical protein